MADSLFSPTPDVQWAATDDAQWAEGGWSVYEGPLPVQAGTLEFFSVDALGNAEAVQSRTFSLGDVTPPAVTAFTVGAPVLLTVPVTAFTASDDAAVTGYLITESATPPAAGAAGWSASAPTSYTAASAGARTLYPWAKDAAGNVSPAFGSPRTVTFVVDATPPTTTASPAAGVYAAAQTVTLTASEAATVRWRLNAGAWSAGAASPVTVPNVSGLLEWYGTDAAGNAEATRSGAYWLEHTVALDGAVSLSGELAATFATLAQPLTAAVVSLVASGNAQATLRLVTPALDAQGAPLTTYEVYVGGQRLLPDLTAWSQGSVRAVTGLANGQAAVLTVRGKDAEGTLAPASNAVTATPAAPVGPASGRLRNVIV